MHTHTHTPDSSTDRALISSEMSALDVRSVSVVVQIVNTFSFACMPVSSRASFYHSAEIGYSYLIVTSGRCGILVYTHIRIT